MRWLMFIKLFKMIFGKKLPDLDYIQKKGLLAVKIAQTFALRIDFLSEETCTHLAQLYTHTTPIQEEDFFELLKSYVNPSWFDHIQSIEPKPLGSASVGQVHLATLKTGEKVVIKVIKKNFKKAFEKDVRSLRRLIKFVIFFYPKLAKVADPVGILEHIEEYTLAELDLRNEIAHGKILKDIYEKNKDQFDLSRLKFPFIYEDLSSEHVLVSEFIDGPTADDLLKQKKLPFNDILEIFHIHGFYIFLIGTFHGDLHPGNLIVKDKDYYFIDTGAISKVGPKIQTGLFEFMTYLSQYDYDGCAHALNHMADHEISGKRFDQYHEKMLKLYEDFAGKTVSEVSLTRKMMETIKLGVHSGMVFEKGMFPIIKSMMYLDGMVLKGAPDTVLMEEMRRFIKEFRDADAVLRK
ncbi:MAG TPA: AarF/ABC1/UbiB kinase family protein [Acholeplasmataceae bacterium]|nr:AarF/ABC1/UbiB kinase family protein [Acholeplasmataceae bacterium]